MSRLFASIPRLVRELSVELQRKYNLVIEGADTELDRQLIETIRDPIMHLIRNCADHGIESPRIERRQVSRKPEKYPSPHITSWAKSISRWPTMDAGSMPADPLKVVSGAWASRGNRAYER